MFQKLHLKLALFGTIIINLILIIMSVCFIAISEKSQRANAFFSFREDITAFVSNLNETRILSHSWLQGIENTRMRIQIIDNGTPYLFNQFSSDNLFSEFNEILSYYEENYDEPAALNQMQSFHVEFLYFDKKGPQAAGSDKRCLYFASGISMFKNNAPLTVLVLAPQDALNRSLLNQRLMIILVFAASSLILSSFFWFFTKKLLIPLKTNQENQIQFVANASHELRTPVTVILSSIGACEIAPPPEQKIFFSNIRQECRQMQRLINDMLFLSNSGKSFCDYHMAPASPDTIILNVYEGLKPVASEKAITLSLSLPEDEIPLCHCDSERIFQALSALVQNAISYTPKGGSILLTLKVSPHYFYLSVADTGCGISPSDREHIFDRFYRAQDSHSERNHFGLGLCIVKDIIDAHKGNIYVTQNKPKGSIFTIRLAHKGN